MKTIGILNTILILGLILLPWLGHTQESPAAEGGCNEKYLKALTLFENGNIDEVIRLLSPCADGLESVRGMDNNSKADIYWLLARSYALRKKQADMKRSYREMLTYLPLFSPRPNEQESILDLHKKLWVQPKLAFYMVGGPLWSSVELRKSREVLVAVNGADTQKKYAKAPIGYQAGLGGLYRISKNLQINIEAILLNRVVSYSRTVLSRSTIQYNTIGGLGEPIDTLGSITNEFTAINDHEQKFNHLTIPISLRGILPLSKSLSIYIEAGAYSSWLLSTQNQIKTEEKSTLIASNFITGDEDTETIFLDSDITTNNKKLFTRNEFGGLLGGGLQMLIKKKYHINLGAKYLHSFVNVTEQEVRFTGNSLLSFYDVMDDLSVHALSLSASIVFPLQYTTYDFKRK